MLALAAAGWQEEGQKGIVSLRTKLPMKSFKGQQQLESHLDAQRQPAHLARAAMGHVLNKVLPTRQVATVSFAFQTASEGSLEWGLLLDSEVAVREGIIICFSSKTAWPSKCV